MEHFILPHDELLRDKPGVRITDEAWAKLHLCMLKLSKILYCLNCTIAIATLLIQTPNLRQGKQTLFTPPVLQTFRFQSWLILLQSYGPMAPHCTRLNLFNLDLGIGTPSLIELSLQIEIYSVTSGMC